MKFEEVIENVEVSESVKEIPNFSRYLCDIKNGRVWRKPTEKLQGKWLNPKPNHIGYVKTTIVNDEGELQSIFLHELVMSAAIEFPKSWWKSKNLEIDHRDRNKSNNNFDNLWLRTKKQNHENIDKENRKSHVHLTKDEVNYIMDSFRAWEGKKIVFYQLKAKQFGCVWQTIQYTVLGYNNQNKLVSNE